MTPVWIPQGSVEGCLETKAPFLDINILNIIDESIREYLEHQEGLNNDLGEHPRNETLW